MIFRRKERSPGALAIVRSGFTLIELLVVIAIIGVLVGLLLPAVQQAREAARRSSCSNNMKQQGLAVHNYADVNPEKFPVGWVGEYESGEWHGDEGEGWGFAAQLLPFMEQKNLFDSFDMTKQVGDTVNAAAIATVVTGFRCPSDGYGDGDIHTPTGASSGFAVSNYPGVFGSEHIAGHEHASAAGWLMSWVGTVALLSGDDEGLEPGEGNGIFFAGGANGENGVSFRDVRDGLSKTIMIGERDSREGHSCWAGRIDGVNEAMTRVVGVGEHVFNNSDPHFEDFFSSHPGGVNFAFADGHVAFLSDGMSDALFQSLSTRAGGEVVNGDY
tara:strand:- start:53 stop:1039 length:987 start_codon:yes stop_codon:yes gene_type:complete